MTRGYTFI